MGATTPSSLLFYCKAGKHRSVGLMSLVAHILDQQGVHLELSHPALWGQPQLCGCPLRCKHMYLPNGEIRDAQLLDWHMQCLDQARAAAEATWADLQQGG